MGAASLIILLVLIPFVGYALYQWQMMLAHRRMLHGRLAVLALRAVRPAKPLSSSLLIRMRTEMANQDQAEHASGAHDNAGKGPAAPERGRMAGKSGMANQIDGNRDWNPLDMSERMMPRETREVIAHRQAEDQELRSRIENFSKRRVVMQQRATWMRVNAERQKAATARASIGMKAR